MGIEQVRFLANHTNSHAYG